MPNTPPRPEREQLAEFIENVSLARFQSDEEALTAGLVMIDGIVADRLAAAIAVIASPDVPAYVLDYLDRRIVAERTHHTPADDVPEQPDPLETNPRDLAAGEDYDADGDPR